MSKIKADPIIILKDIKYVNLDMASFVDDVQYKKMSLIDKISINM